MFVDDVIDKRQIACSCKYSVSDSAGFR